MMSPYREVVAEVRPQGGVVVGGDVARRRGSFGTRLMRRAAGIPPSMSSGPGSGLQLPDRPSGRRPDSGAIL
jgi:hypothetical protein